MKLILTCVFIYYINCVPSIIAIVSKEANQNYNELAKNLGMDVANHDVITEDGYILRIFHIAPLKALARSLPLLLMHGITGSADDFLLRGNISLAYTLHKRGYDVWAGNHRGNKYNRRHISLNPGSNREFWNFTVHEHGYYDMPAVIDYILLRTGHKKVNVIGHSQGTTNVFILAATRPQYNHKINLLTALAPIAFLNDMGQTFMSIISALFFFNQILTDLGIEEVFSDGQQTILRILCSSGQLGYEICTKGFIFALGGEDAEELEPKFLPVAIGHYPQSVSRKCLLHYGQISRAKRFMQYDYGPDGNLNMYNRLTPPDYDLDLITIKVALFYGANDAVSTSNNVELLKSKLPNVVDYYLVTRAQWNHYDWVWAKHLDTYLHPHLLQTLEIYGTL